MEHYYLRLVDNNHKEIKEWWVPIGSTIEIQILDIIECVKVEREVKE